MQKKFLWILLLSIWSSISMATQCSIDVVSVDFDGYHSRSSQGNKATGSVKVQCLGVRTNYEIKLGPGRGRSYAQRKMYNSNIRLGTLKYNLYLDPAYSTIWGNGTNGTSMVIGDTRSCLRRSTCIHTVYGYIPPRQRVASGKYSDNMVVVISF